MASAIQEKGRRAAFSERWMPPLTKPKESLLLVIVYAEPTVGK
jgi:hypothetical protein